MMTPFFALVQTSPALGIAFQRYLPWRGRASARIPLSTDRPAQPCTAAVLSILAKTVGELQYILDILHYILDI